MHAVSKYSDLLKAVLRQAEQMVECLPTGYHYAAGQDIINFLHDYGCEGYPSGQAGEFIIGPWLYRSDTPKTQGDCVTVIPCFSDDVPPYKPPFHEDDIIAGHCFSADQLIVLYAVEQWSVAELALNVLHEGRHARHRIGPKLAGLSPLDRDELHETNTWLVTLNIVSTWGGASWAAAVRREADWLAAQALTPNQPRGIMYAASKQYWPELDRVFGSTKHNAVRKMRQSLVVLAANIEYWSQQNSTLLPEQICHSALAYFYH